MSQNITFNGTAYVIPDLGELNWGQNLTDYFVAIPTGALQKTGGTFTLSADINFGASFGLVSQYFKSRTADISTTGVLRLANTDSIGFRNAGNSADLLLGVNGSNQLTFNGVILESDTLPSGQMFVGDSGDSSTARAITGAWAMSNLGVASINNDYITNAMISPTAAIALTKLAALTISKSLVSDGSGVISTGWSYAAGNMQTTVNGALRFTDGTTNYVGFVAPTSVTTHTYALPIAAGSAGQVLSWQAGGQLQWINAAGGGTINSGTQYQLAYYSATGTILSGATLITASRALASDANGLPVASATTAAELGYVSGVTSSIQTQLGDRLLLAGGTMTGAIALSAGTVLLPSLTFSGDLNTGMYAIAADTIGWTAGGVQQLSLDGSYLSVTGRIRIQDGTVSSPSIQFTSDTDTGFYWNSDNIFRIAAGGSGICQFYYSSATAYDKGIDILSGARILNTDGAVATPSYSFGNDSDTGIYRPSANVLSLAAGGIQVSSISTTGLAMNGYKITGLAAATTNGDALRYEQLEELNPQNLLDNSGFEIWQRGTSFSSPGMNVFTADRWQVSLSTGSPVFTVSREASIVQDGSYSMKIAVTGTAVSDLRLVQRLSSSVKLNPGATVTFSARVRTNTANKIKLGLYNGSTGAYSSYHTGDDTWQTLSVSQGWTNSDNQAWIIIETESTSTTYIDDAVLTIGSQKKAFYPMPPAIDLIRCQRYYEKTLGNLSQIFNINRAASTNICRQYVSFKVEKPSAPTMTLTKTVVELTHIPGIGNGFSSDTANWTLTSSGVTANHFGAVFTRNTDQATYSAVEVNWQWISEV